MTERYQPPSEFLRAFVADEVTLEDSIFGEANLQRLVELTCDNDTANRDWATMLLSAEEIDTPQVRQALLKAARDTDSVVRAEAMYGLAMRDRALALPLVLEELRGDSACMALFEAAALVADPALVPLLREWTEPSDERFLDELAAEALAACEAGISPS